MFLLQLLAAAAATTSVFGSASLEYDPRSGAITADARDFIVTGSSGNANEAPISLQALVQELASLKGQVKDLSTLKEKVEELSARETGPTAVEVTSSVDAAVAGAITLLLTGDNELTTGVAGLKTRLGAVDKLLAGLPETRKAVSDIAYDVAYLLEHSANVTSCAAAGDIHHRDGTCVDPVPQCKAPAAPAKGTVALSSKFIIPGVTATYACPDKLGFVAGPTTRTCVEATLQFDGADPACKVCAVTNCVRCVTDENTCAECAYGHDLAADSKSCPERTDTVIMISASAQSLAAKASYCAVLSSASPVLWFE